MKPQTLLVVEDEPDIQELLRFHLKRQGFSVIACANGREAVDAARQHLPSLVLLDLMLPGLNGLDVCRTLKGDARTAAIPVVMLTARGDEADIVAGLELGADDYIAKPFSIKVLLARIRTVLRRRQAPAPGEQAPMRIHALEIDPGRHEVLLDGKPVAMTFSELRILQLLAGRPGWAMTREQIVNAVRGEDYAVTDRAVDVQIVGIRRKLGRHAAYIETVRGVGYRFKETE